MSFEGEMYPPFAFDVPIQPYVVTLAQQLERERAHNLMLLSQLAQERQLTYDLSEQLKQSKASATVCAHSVYSQASLSCSTAQPLFPPLVGRYSSEIRQLKIAKYKAKMRGHLLKARLRRSCKGRSLVAQGKPRIRGRFIKSDT